MPVVAASPRAAPPGAREYSSWGRQGTDHRPPAASGEQDLRHWLPVLLLHRVVDTAPRQNPYLLQTSTGYLDWMLGWLRSRGYRLAGLSEVVQAMQGDSQPERMVAVTFDDGYSDFLTHALPVLEAHRCPATVFVVSGLLGRTNAWDAGRLPATSLMTAEEVRQIAERGVEVASHGVAHLRLTRISTAERRAELVRSKTDLESLIQREVRWFAYPFTEQDATARQEAAAAGYDAAFAGEQGVHRLFAVHRIAVGEPPAWWLDLRLRGMGFRARNSVPLRALSRLRRRAAAGLGGSR